ncbi:MAG TPA: hypothetical protein VGL78_07000 [Solirubrobacteraceae bacterium]|jgi:hypothetical protein
MGAPLVVPRFEFRWDLAYRRVARLFGITPERAEVTLEDGVLGVRYGRWRLRTPAANIVRIRIEGPYAFLKTAGPPRLGITDRGITFASNGDRGLRLGLCDPVPGIEPTGRLRHPHRHRPGGPAGCLATSGCRVDQFPSQ